MEETKSEHFLLDLCNFGDGFEIDGKPLLANEEVEVYETVDRVSDGGGCDGKDEGGYVRREEEVE